MGNCKNCRIQVATPSRICPLCRGELDLTGEEESTFPQVGYSHSTVKIIHLVSTVLMVLFLGAILVDLVQTRRSFWYLIATLGSIYLGASLLYSLKSRQGVGYTLLKMVVVLSAVAVAVDLSTGFHRWSTSYVIPFLVMGASFVVALILLIKPRWFRDYFISQITLSFLGLMTLFLRIFGLVSATWPVTVASLCSLATILGLFVFYGRRSLHEVKKRLHI